MTCAVPWRLLEAPGPSAEVHRRAGAGYPQGLRDGGWGPGAGPSAQGRRVRHVAALESRHVPMGRLGVDVMPSVVQNDYALKDCSYRARIRLAAGASGYSTSLGTNSACLRSLNQPLPRLPARCPGRACNSAPILAPMTNQGQQGEGAVKRGHRVKRKSRGLALTDGSGGMRSNPPVPSDGGRGAFPSGITSGMLRRYEC